MIEQRVMELGERRRITVTLWLADEQAFTPDAPTWELIQTNQPIETVPLSKMKEVN